MTKLSQSIGKDTRNPAKTGGNEHEKEHSKGVNSKKRGATPRHATKPPQWMNNTGGLKPPNPLPKKDQRKCSTPSAPYYPQF